MFTSTLATGEPLTSAESDVEIRTSEGRLKLLPTGLGQLAIAKTNAVKLAAQAGEQAVALGQQINTHCQPAAEKLKEWSDANVVPKVEPVLKPAQAWIDVSPRSHAPLASTPLASPCYAPIAYTALASPCPPRRCGTTSLLDSHEAQYHVPSRLT